jgi:hypothetical protein
MKNEERTYGFLVTGGSTIETRGRNPQEAFKKADERIRKLRPIYKELGIDIGTLTCRYVAFGKNDFIAKGAIQKIKGCRRK